MRPSSDDLVNLPRRGEWANFGARELDRERDVGGDTQLRVAHGSTAGESKGGDSGLWSGGTTHSGRRHVAGAPGRSRPTPVGATRLRSDDGVAAVSRRPGDPLHGAGAIPSGLRRLAAA